MKFVPFVVTSLVLVAATLTVNWSSLEHGFVYDDRALILERPPVWSGSLGAFLRTRHWGAGRHLTVLSLDLDRGPDLDAGPFHRTNVALAALVTLAVFALGVKLGLFPFAAASSALVFAVHPTHADAVAAVSGRAELLAALFVLAALWLHADTKREHWGAALVAGGLLLLGIASKESAAGLPLLILAHYATIGRSGGMAFPWRTLLVQGAALMLWLALFGANLGSLDVPLFIDNPLYYVPHHERVAKASWILIDYARLLFWPQGLRAIRSFADTDPSLLAGGIGLILWCSLGALLWRVRRISPRAVFFVLWFPVAFALSGNVAFPIGTIMAERLVFLPSVGPALLLGLGLQTVVENRPRLRIATAVPALVCVLLLAQVYVERAAAWRSEVVFFEQAVRDAPRSAKAHYDLGLVLARRGQAARAQAEFARAREIYGDFEQAVVYEARASVEAGRGEEAAAILGVYLKQYPERPIAVTELVGLLMRLDRGAEALDWTRRLVELKPGDMATLGLLNDVERFARSPQRREGNGRDQ